MSKEEKLERKHAQYAFHIRNPHLEWHEDNHFYNPLDKTHIYYHLKPLTPSEVDERVLLQKELKGRCITIFYHAAPVFANNMKLFSEKGLNFDFG